MTQNKDISEIHNRVLIRKGQNVVRQGDQGHTAYLVQSGSVRVYSEEDGKKVEFAILGPGQIFGETSLLAGARRGASVEAVEDTNLIVITKDLLDQKLKKSDPTIRALVPMLAQRIMSTNKALLNQQSSIEGLREAITTTYKNIQSDLPPQKKQAFNNLVLPALNDFLEGLKTFQMRYLDD